MFNKTFASCGRRPLELQWLLTESGLVVLFYKNQLLRLLPLCLLRLLLFLLLLLLLLFLQLTPAISILERVDALIVLLNISRVGGGVHRHQVIFSLLLLISSVDLTKLAVNDTICCKFSMRRKDKVNALYSR